MTEQFMTEQTFQIKGMHCASCVSIIEKNLKKQKGIHEVSVNFGTETAKISFDESVVTPHDLSKTLEPFGYSFVVPESVAPEAVVHGSQDHSAHTGVNQTKEEKLREIATMRRKVLISIPLAVLSFIIMGW